MDWTKTMGKLRGASPQDLRPDERLSEDNVLYPSKEAMETDINERYLEANPGPFKKLLPTEMESFGKGLYEGADSAMIEDEQFRQDVNPNAFAAGETLGSASPTNLPIGVWMKLQEMLKKK